MITFLKTYGKFFPVLEVKIAFDFFLFFFLLIYFLFANCLKKRATLKNNHIKQQKCKYGDTTKFNVLQDIVFSYQEIR